MSLFTTLLSTHPPSSTILQHTPDLSIIQENTIYFKHVYFYILKLFKKIIFLFFYFKLIFIDIFIFLYSGVKKKLKIILFQLFTSELFFEKQSQLFICFKTCVIAVKYVYQNRFLFKIYIKLIIFRFFYYLTHNNYLLIVFEM
jgi:hypothetical protein